MTSHVIDPEGLPHAVERLARRAALGAEALFALDLRAGVAPGAPIA